MNTFYKKIDLRDKREMIDFLGCHFRYNTMNSWNASTSYANCVKVHRVGLSSEQESKLFQLIQCEEFYFEMEELLDVFGREHNWNWQVKFNGRSGGYLVLYQGYEELSGHKSYCTECGQQNFKSVAENGEICGRCHNHSRIDYETPPKMIGIYPGRSTDYDEDFEDWSMYELRERVKLVQKFDMLCDDVVKTAARLADECQIEEKTVYHPEVVYHMVDID